MILRSQDWHVRWFHFVQSKIGNPYLYSSGTNLCHFMRVTCLWGPLVAGFFLVAMGVVAFFFGVLLFVLPFQRLGFAGIALVWGILGLSAITAYASFILIGRYGNKLAPVGSMMHCVYQHAKAVKGRFCPVVRFGGGGGAW